MNKNTKFPFLIVQKTKHTIEYYFITSEADYYAAMLQMFEVHDNNGYYSFDQITPPDEITITPEIAANKEMVAAAQRNNRQRKRVIENNELMALQKEMYDRAKNSGDEMAAECLLLERKDYEYEDWSEESVWTNTISIT